MREYSRRSRVSPHASPSAAPLMTLDHFESFDMGLMVQENAEYR